jgi:hypothetical protein
MEQGIAVIATALKKTVLLTVATVMNDGWHCRRAGTADPLRLLQSPSIAQWTVIGQSPSNNP